MCKYAVWKTITYSTGARDFVIYVDHIGQVSGVGAAVNAKFMLDSWNSVVLKVRQAVALELEMI